MSWRLRVSFIVYVRDVQKRRGLWRDVNSIRDLELTRTHFFLIKKECMNFYALITDIRMPFHNESKPFILDFIKLFYYVFKHVCCRVAISRSMFFSGYERGRFVYWPVRTQTKATPFWTNWLRFAGLRHARLNTLPTYPNPYILCLKMFAEIIVN